MRTGLYLSSAVDGMPLTCTAAATGRQFWCLKKKKMTQPKLVDPALNKHTMLRFSTNTIGLNQKLTVESR